MIQKYINSTFYLFQQELEDSFEEAKIKRSEFIENNQALLDMPGTNRPNRR